jgi:long-chain acyl-CoA synthetase
LDSVGKVTPGVYLKIQNENGEECKINESGEIFTKGKSVSKGYITSKMSIKNDWLSTGDIGYKNEKDYIFLNGRKNDLINIGGKKVSPLEIENMINLIPSISECACIGISDPNGISGNIISALLVLKKSKENIYNKISDIDLTAYLRENLESYKIPSEFNWIDKIPKTSLGKIKRNIIK